MNMDPVMHDIQAYETSQLGPRVLFNTPLPMNPHHKRLVSAESHEHLAGTPVTEVIRMTKGRRMFVMQCGFHAYMESWGFAVDNPYFALTADDGTFSLTDVPPGEYTLMVWHPGVGTMLQKKVTVTEKGLSTVDFDFKAPWAGEACMKSRRTRITALNHLGRLWIFVPHCSARFHKVGLKEERGRS